MYIDRLTLRNFRNFREAEVEFVHPDRRFSRAGNGATAARRFSVPKPKLANVNLLLGDNGLGKSTLLKAIALAALGPAVGDSGIYPYRLIRREPGARARGGRQPKTATIEATFTAHPQDRTEGIPATESRIAVVSKGDLESLQWKHPDEKPWHPIFSASSDAFFFVGYGATRRVEKRERLDIGGRKSSAFVRAQRVQSLFEEAYSLIPLNAWLPQFSQRNPGRYKQVAGLVNALIGPGHYRFTGRMEQGEYLFDRGGLSVPFPALSDGYRAFLGWVGDLMYHVCMTCPSGKKLVDNRGIVLVDEIDLHLHPKWQLTALPTLAKALPNLQFIVTSHSPLVVGSLEWMNIIVMAPSPDQSSVAKRVEWAVHGLDADQVLLSEFFGLDSTRAPGKKRRLKTLSLRAREGDMDAAKKLLEEMSRGLEPKG